MNHADHAELHRALAELRVALDDADAITQDMLRPPGERDLGPRLHARNYHDAHRKMEELITFLVNSINSTDPPPPPPHQHH